MVGQKVVSETGPRRFTQNSDFGLIETDVEGHRCVMNRLLFGIAVREDLQRAPLDFDYCCVDYHCGFEFSKGWRVRATLTALIGASFGAAFSFGVRFREVRPSIPVRCGNAKVPPPNSYLVET